MVLHGMRRVIPKPEQSRFAPVYEGETALKNIVGFKDPEAAYVVVATSGGKVVWTSPARLRTPASWSCGRAYLSSSGEPHGIISA